MAESPERDFDEPDFAKHVATVVQDAWDHALDGPDEAVEAILEHPAIREPVLDPIAERKLQQITDAMALDLARGMSQGLPPRELVAMLLKIPEVSQGLKARAMGRLD